MGRLAIGLSWWNMGKLVFPGEWIIYTQSLQLSMWSSFEIFEKISCTEKMQANNVWNKVTAQNVLLDLWGFWLIYWSKSNWKGKALFYRFEIMMIFGLIKEFPSLGSYFISARYFYFLLLELARQQLARLYSETSIWCHWFGKNHSIWPWWRVLQKTGKLSWLLDKT